MQFTEESYFNNDGARAHRTNSNISGVNPLQKGRRGSTKTTLKSNVVAAVDSETTSTMGIDNITSQGIFSTVEIESPSSPPPPVPPNAFSNTKVHTVSNETDTHEKDEYDERPSAGLSFSGLYPNRFSTLDTEVSSVSQHPSARLPPPLPLTQPPPLPQMKPFSSSVHHQQQQHCSSRGTIDENMTTIRLDDDVNEPYQARTVPKPAVGPERSVSTAVRRASSNIMSFTAGLAAGFTSNMYTSEEDQPRGSADLSMGGLYSAESMFQNDDFSSNGGNTSSKAGPAPSSAKPQFAQLPELATTIPPDVELQCVAWKQCPTVALLWQERFLVMKNDGTIHYYESREAYIHRFAPKGVIALRDVQQNEFARNGVYDSVAIFQNRLNIHVNSKNNRVYKLKFATAEEAAQWKQAIGKYLDMFFNR